MEAGEILHIVTTECLSKDEERFHKWYNEVHIPMLLKFKKMTSVTRYEVMNKPGAPTQFVAVYRFANKPDFEFFNVSPERTAALKEMRESWGDRIKITSVAQWETIKSWPD